MFNQKQYIQVSVVSVHTTSNGTTSVAGLMKIYGVFEDTHFNFTKRQSDLLGETQRLQYQMASHYALFLVVGRTTSLSQRLSVEIRYHKVEILKRILFYSIFENDCNDLDH